jgi:asparagine synthase (glutamine-hydrolysing)
MCGIAGFVGPGTADDIKRMADAMIHRGPDGEGYFADQHLPVFLASRRLAVVDIPGGRQPMWDAGGDVCVVYNGEIYNHRALRRRLEHAGARFQTDHADTEVLIHGYRAWGAGLWRELNGMFAVALYDRHRKRLILARDRFGEKPLFYGRRGPAFGFASELTALRRHPSFGDAALSQEALQKYFAHGFFPGPHTPYAGLSKLLPGHALTLAVDSGAMEIAPYWRFAIAPDAAPPGHHEDWAVEVDHLLTTAVQARLEADVPVGIFLSGGIDSSAVLSCASDVRAPATIKTFSIGFRETSYDESPYAEEVALGIGSTHHVEICDLEAIEGDVPALLARMDEPIGDGSLVPTSLLAAFARKHVTVALTGDGGDELFAGYDPFRMLKRAQAYHALVPGPVHTAVKMLAGWLPVSDANMSFDFVLRRGLNGLMEPPALWNPRWLAPLQPDEIADLFAMPVHSDALYSEVIAAWDACESPHLVDRVLDFYTRFYLPDQILVKADRASMAVSLEARAPFLDYDLADYVRRLPWQAKLRGGVTKWILRRALKDRLPADVLARRKKGFGIPAGRWLRELAPPPATPGLNDRWLRKLWDAHAAGRDDHRLALWSWLALAHGLKGAA